MLDIEQLRCPRQLHGPERAQRLRQDDATQSHRRRHCRPRARSSSTTPRSFALPEPRRDRFRAEHIGYVFQTFNLLAAFSALENVMLAMMFATPFRGASSAGAPARFWPASASARGSSQARQLRGASSSGSPSRARWRTPAVDPRGRAVCQPGCRHRAGGARRVLSVCREEGEDPARRVPRRRRAGAAITSSTSPRSIAPAAGASRPSVMRVMTDPHGRLKYLRGRRRERADAPVRRARRQPGHRQRARGGHQDGFHRGDDRLQPVVGAKGSPTQLVLNVVFRMDVADAEHLLHALRDLRTTRASRWPCRSDG